MLLANTGAGNNLAVNAAVTSTTGAITANSSGSITETGGSFGSTGLLTTTSVGGTTLNGSNTVGSFNATNNPTNSGLTGIQLINTAATLNITGVVETGGGGATVTNTGNETISGLVVTAPFMNSAGPLTLTASGAVSETGVGLINTEGLLSTNSAIGTSLLGAANALNLVGSFTAVNTTSGPIFLNDNAGGLALTLTIPASGINNMGTNGIVTISEEGGSLVVNGNVNSATDEVFLMALTAAPNLGNSSLTINANVMSNTHTELSASGTLSVIGSASVVVSNGNAILQAGPALTIVSPTATVVTPNGESIFYGNFENPSGTTTVMVVGTALVSSAQSLFSAFAGTGTANFIVSPTFNPTISTNQEDVVGLAATNNLFDTDEANPNPSTSTQSYIVTSNSIDEIVTAANGTETGTAPVVYTGMQSVYAIGSSAGTNTFTVDSIAPDAATNVVAEGLNGTTASPNTITDNATNPAPLVGSALNLYGVTTGPIGVTSFAINVNPPPANIPATNVFGPVNVTAGGSGNDTATLTVNSPLTPNPPTAHQHHVIYHHGIRRNRAEQCRRIATVQRVWRSAATIQRQAPGH